VACNGVDLSSIIQQITIDFYRLDCFWDPVIANKWEYVYTNQQLVICQRLHFVSIQFFVIKSWEKKPIRRKRKNLLHVQFESIFTMVNFEFCHWLIVKIRIYLARTKNFQNHTFDSSKLQTDILNFVSTASEDGTSSIQVLSTIRNQNTQATWKSYTDFKRYDRMISNSVEINE